jgi:hypothetical protein
MRLMKQLSIVALFFTSTCLAALLENHAVLEHIQGMITNAQKSKIIEIAYKKYNLTLSNPYNKVAPISEEQLRQRIVQNIPSLLTNPKPIIFIYVMNIKLSCEPLFRIKGHNKLPTLSDIKIVEQAEIYPIKVSKRTGITLDVDVEKDLCIDIKINQIITST